MYTITHRAPGHDFWRKDFEGWTEQEAIEYAEFLVIDYDDHVVVYDEDGTEIWNSDFDVFGKQNDPDEDRLAKADDLRDYLSEDK